MEVTPTFGTGTLTGIRTATLLMATIGMAIPMATAILAVGIIIELGAWTQGRRFGAEGKT